MERKAISLEEKIMAKESKVKKLQLEIQELRRKQDAHIALEVKGIMQMHNISTAEELRELLQMIKEGETI